MATNQSGTSYKEVSLLAHNTYSVSARSLVIIITKLCFSRGSIIKLYLSQPTLPRMKNHTGAQQERCSLVAAEHKDGLMSAARLLLGCVIAKPHLRPLGPDPLPQMQLILLPPQQRGASRGSVNPPHVRKLELPTQSFLVLFNDIIRLKWLCQAFILPDASCTRPPIPGDRTVVRKVTGSFGPFKTLGIFKGLEAMDTCHQLTR